MLQFIIDHFLLFAAGWVYFSFAVGIAAKIAGKSFFTYTLAALYMSPPLVYMYLLGKVALEKAPPLFLEPEDNVRAWALQHCPHCHTTVRTNALECWGCHRPLE